MTGLGTGRNGIKATRSATTPTAMESAINHGRRGARNRRNRGRQPLFQAQNPARTKAISNGLKSWRTPCQMPARFMMITSSSRVVVASTSFILIKHRPHTRYPIESLGPRGRRQHKKENQGAGHRGTDQAIMRLAHATEEGSWRTPARSFR